MKSTAFQCLAIELRGRTSHLVDIVNNGKEVVECLIVSRRARQEI